MNEDCFNKNGYCIVDDFLSKDLAIQLYDIFNSQPESGWQYNDQVREKHYEHVFRTNNLLLPKKNESYSAQFWRSESIEMSSEFKKIVKEKFSKKIREMVSDHLNEFDTRAYRLDKGDHYRIHIDSYAGNVNIVYYLNEEWIWDWGGILHICSGEDEEYCKPIFPDLQNLALYDSFFLGNKRLLVLNTCS